MTGTPALPSGVATADGCAGKVTVQAKAKANTSACTFKATLTVARRGTVSLSAAFAGNASVSGVDARAVKVRAG